MAVRCWGCCGARRSTLLSMVKLKSPPRMQWACPCCCSHGARVLEMKERWAVGLLVPEGPYTLAKASLWPPHEQRPPASLPSPLRQMELLTHAKAPPVKRRSLTKTATPAVPASEDAHNGTYGATWWCCDASSSWVWARPSLASVRRVSCSSTMSSWRSMA